MIKNLRKKDLRNFALVWHYSIVAEHDHEYKVTKKIPFNVYQEKFPEYLKGYENYYEKGSYCWYLKSEYLRNRPTYTFTVTHPRFDIVLTKDGEKRAKKFIDFHKRMLKKYEKLLQA